MLPTYPVSWRDGEELLPEPAVTRLVGLVNSSSWQRVGCLVALLPQRWGWMVPTSAYANIWQIFGKMVFDKFPYEWKVRMAAYLLVIYGGPGWT